MAGKLFAAVLFGVMNLISSNPVSNEHNRDTCIFRDGEKVPTFIYHLGGDQFIEILCSKDTCHCDGSSTGYKGCQSCCCAMREKHEGNKKTNKVHSRVNCFLVADYQLKIFMKIVCIVCIVIGMLWICTKQLFFNIPLKSFLSHYQCFFPIHCQHYSDRDYLFEVTMEILEKGVEYVQS